MKKTVFLIVLLFCLCIYGCSTRHEAVPNGAPTASPSSVPAPLPSPVLTPSPAPAPSSTPEAPPLVPELPEIHDAALEGIFEGVLSVYPGSAGSSLRAAKCASWLLDWGAVTNLTDDEIYSAVGSWLEQQSDDRMHVFLESILKVYDCCYDLRGENAPALLLDAGVESSLYPWNDQAFHAVEMVCYGCGVR